MAASTRAQAGPHRWDRTSRWARSSPLVVDLLTSAAVAAVLAPWSLFLLFTDGSEAERTGAMAARAPWSAVVTGAVVLGHAALAARRVRPLVSFALVSVAVGVQLALCVWLVLPSMLVVLPSLFSCAAYGRRGAPAVGLAVATAGVVVTTVVGFALTTRAEGAADVLTHGLARLLPALVAAWGLGVFQRARLTFAERLAELERSERVRRAVADERNRIAREMHDVIAHALSVMISQANGGRYAAGNDPGRAADALTTIARTGQQALDDTRGLLVVLRTGGAQEDGPFPQPQLSELPELLDRVRAAGVPVEHVEHGAARRLGPAAELAVFRLVQESLTNTVKHARSGARARVRFEWSPDELVVTVDDDGGGATATNGGQGLIGMRERLAMVGGSASVDPAHRGGFRVQARLPRSADAAGDGAA